MRMIVKLAVAVGLVIMVFTSCENALNEFGIPLESGVFEKEFSIPPAKAGDMAYIEEILATDLEEILEEHGKVGSLIKEVKVSMATIEVLEKSDVKNLNALETIELALALDSSGKKTIASATNTEEDATSISLEVEDIDVSSILNAKEYKIALTGALKEDLTETLWVVGKIKYEIILGLSANN